jgi:hypothetical protein
MRGQESAASMNEFKVSISREARMLLSENAQLQLARKAMKRIARMQRQPDRQWTFRGPLDLLVAVDWQNRMIRISTGPGECDEEL